MKVLEKVAKTISRNYGVNITFSGGIAYTDGKRINIPALPDGHEIEQVLHGYCDHECGHVKHSDFRVMLDATRINPNLGKVLNFIEDLRIERLMIKEFGGIRENLKKTMAHLAEKGLDLESPMMWLWVEGRRDYGVEIIAPDLFDKVVGYFGADIFEKIRALKNTREALELAMEIESAAKDAPEEGGSDDSKDGSDDSKKETKDSSDDSGSDSDDSSDSGSDSDNSSGSSDSGSDNSKGDSEKDTNNAKELPGGPKETTGEGGKDGSKNTTAPTIKDSNKKKKTIKDIEKFIDPMDQLKKEIETIHTGAVTDGKYMSYSTALDKIIKVKPEKTLDGYRSLKKALGPVNVIKKRVVNLFNSKNMDKWVGDREHGKINNRALTRVKIGDTRVFKERYRTTAKNTCVSFLLDFSGSMGSSGVAAALSSAILLVEAFEESGIKTEILGYTTGGAYDGPEYGSVDYTFYGYMAGRNEILHTYVFKEFGESYGPTVKARLGAGRTIDRRNNCDGENVKIAYDRIKVRPEARKVLFVLSDGAVENYGNCMVGKRYLKEVCGEIEKAKVVELIGVDLFSGQAGFYYKNTIVIKNGERLADKLFQGIKQILK